MERALGGAGLGLACWVGWVATTILAAAGYLGGGVENSFEAVPFAVAFAAASGSAAALAWAVAGDRRKAVAFATVAMASIASLALLGYLDLWGHLDAARGAVGLGRRGPARLWPHLFDRWAGLAQTAVAGLVPGLAAGGLAGALLILGRRRPVLASGLALGLLVSAGPIAPVLAGRAVGRVLAWRNEGGAWNDARLGGDEVPTGLGAGAGALCGAALAGMIRRRDVAPPA